MLGSAASSLNFEIGIEGGELCKEEEEEEEEDEEEEEEEEGGSDEVRDEKGTEGVFMKVEESSYP
jgi:hypothetical protein